MATAAVVVCEHQDGTDAISTTQSATMGTRAVNTTVGTRANRIFEAEEAAYITVTTTTGAGGAFLVDWLFVTVPELS
jgi:hypothetical protein